MRRVRAPAAAAAAAAMVEGAGVWLAGYVFRPAGGPGLSGARGSRAEGWMAGGAKRGASSREQDILLQLKRGRRDDAGALAGRFLAARFKRVLFTEGEVPPPPWTAPDPVPTPHPPDSPDAALGSVRVARLHPSR